MAFQGGITRPDLGCSTHCWNAMKRQNVNLPEFMMTQFKAKAAMDGEEMSELVNGLANLCNSDF